jgi:hypothetical protein
LPFLPLTSRTMRVTSCPVRGVGQRALIAMQASKAPPRIAVFIGLSLNPEWRVLEGCRQYGGFAESPFHMTRLIVYSTADQSADRHPNTDRRKCTHHLN